MDATIHGQHPGSFDSLSKQHPTVNVEQNEVSSMIVSAVLCSCVLGADM